MSKPFLHLAKIGLVNIDDIDEFIEKWHKSITGMGCPLHEYLGLTMKQYSDWVENPKSLEKLIEDLQYEYNLTTIRRTGSMGSGSE